MELGGHFESISSGLAGVGAGFHMLFLSELRKGVVSKEPVFWSQVSQTINHCRLPRFPFPACLWEREKTTPGIESKLQGAHSLCVRVCFLAWAFCVWGVSDSFPGGSCWSRKIVHICIMHCSFLISPNRSSRVPANGKIKYPTVAPEPHCV